MNDGRLLATMAPAAIADDEVDARQGWLADVARFALTEVKDDVVVEESDGDVVVRQGDAVVTVGRDAFVAGVAGRAPASSSAAERDLLGLGY